jgi:methionine-gamma-lyase
MKSNSKLSLETKAVHGAFNPEEHNYAIKMPLYACSTFKFPDAQTAKAYFEIAYGLDTASKDTDMGMIYSRIDNPNLSVFEKRMAMLDNTEASAVFASGMAAIASTLLSFLRPGQTVLYSQPIYGGTHHFITAVLKEYGIHAVGFSPSDDFDTIQNNLAGALPSVIILENPANPTNAVFDLSIPRRFKEYNPECVVIVDNTYMGPVWSRPLEKGADLVLYSATKFIGGHSDLLAGVVSGSAEHIAQIKAMRSMLGTMASPEICAKLLRSLETLSLRMERQMFNAQKIAAYLHAHASVDKLIYPGIEEEINPGWDQFSGTGTMISFYIKGGENEAFEFLDQLHIFQLAVSLGSTESLAQHPATMTHAAVPAELKAEMGISSALIRLSVGVENFKDLIEDLDQAFKVMLTNEKTEHVEPEGLLV